MKKIIYIGACALAMLQINDAVAQNASIYNRWGVFGSLGVNNINGSVESETGVAQSLKGGMGVTPVLGVYYEAALDKNLSFTVSAGLGYNNFSYSYVGVYTGLGYSMNVDSQIVGVYPDNAGETIKRNTHSLMVIPQAELNFITDPIFKYTTCLEFRLGLGAAIYTNKKKNEFGELLNIQNNTDGLEYFYRETIRMGEGNAWGATFGSFYIGMRWRNTTSDFLNKSTLGVQILMPFNSNRAGGVEVRTEAFSWDQIYNVETAKFRLNTIGLKYSYSFNNRQ